MKDRDSERPSRARVGIIGAGLAGLAAARSLREHGWECVVFDKGRGPGGRSSSRRADGFAFDHGAQYFTAREPGFQSVVADCLRAGVVACWEGRIVALRGSVPQPVREETERFVGVPSMSALPKYLARGLDLRCGTRVAAIARGGAGWELIAGDGTHLGDFSKLLVTAPPAQAAALLGDHSPLTERANKISMAPCWSVMLGLSERLRVEFDGAFCEDSALSWISRNSSKPERASGEAWVLHACADWTKAHLDCDAEQIIALLTRELARVAGVALPRVLHGDAHRWLYSQPESSEAEGAVFDPSGSLALAGDAFNGGRIEGAYMSGLAAADRFLS